MTVDANKTALERGAEAFNNLGGRSGWLDLHDRSVAAHGLGPEPLGWEGLQRFYTGLWTAFPDLQITIEDTVGEGDKVAWRLSVTGTQEAEFRGVPPTGVKVTFGAQYIFRFLNGKIVERWTNFDRLGVLVQLGAVPAPV